MVVRPLLRWSSRIVRQCAVRIETLGTWFWDWRQAGLPRGVSRL